MHQNSDFIHAKVDLLITKSIVEGKSLELVMRIPYQSIAAEIKQFSGNNGVVGETDLKVTIRTELIDSEETNDTEDGITSKDTESH